MKTRFAFSAVAAALMLTACQNPTSTAPSLSTEYNNTQSISAQTSPSSASQEPEAVNSVPGSEIETTETRSEDQRAKTSNDYPTITLEQARAFETELRQQLNDQTEPPALSWLQPANKTEPCLLPMNLRFLQEPNARAYWDGECKDGYAHGLGRDIVLSDYSHLEEITIHDLPANPPRPVVFHDFEMGFTQRGKLMGFEDQAFSGTREIRGRIGGEYHQETHAGLFANTSYTVESSPFGIRQFSKVSFGEQMYYIQIHFNEPENDLISETAVTNQSFQTGGVVRNTMRGGVIEHTLLSDNSSEVVNVPDEYWSPIDAALTRARNEAAHARVNAQTAIDMELAYLRAVCRQDVQAPKGLDIEIYQQICTEPLENKSLYEQALANAQAIYPHLDTLPSYPDSVTLMLDNPNPLSQERLQQRQSEGE
uniref:hypothetical protein n=1 Tax=Thaumasiovibrio occultus TaxID=1891184 RepID=UPI000B351D06|nr:hypothetical protein [Thaumasiovibrio occultus]